MKRSRIFTLFWLFLFLSTAPALSQEAPGAVESALSQEAPGAVEPIQPHPEGDAAIAQIRSPYCPGLMLEVCPTTQAKLLRDSIQILAHAGLPSDSLVAWMLANHGEEYRAVPRTWGSGLFAWVMPPLALLVGFFLVLLALRHFRAQRKAPETRSRSLSEEEESVVAKALEELKAAEEVPF
jgi:cytochrome c-type biogenesis protein CcmH